MPIPFDSGAVPFLLESANFDALWDFGCAPPFGNDQGSPNQVLQPLARGLLVTKLAPGIRRDDPDPSFAVDFRRQFCQEEVPIRGGQRGRGSNIPPDLDSGR